MHTAPGKNHYNGRNVPEVIWSLTSVSGSLGLKQFLYFGSDFLGLTGLAKNELENDQFEVISFQLSSGSLIE